MAIVMEIDEQVLAAKFDTILPHLDERQRRLLMAAEARSLGYGGIALVAQATRVSRVTVAAEVDELDGGRSRWAAARRPGPPPRAADMAVERACSGALDALVEAETRGEPMTRLVDRPSPREPGGGWRSRAPGLSGRRKLDELLAGPGSPACPATPRRWKAASTRTATPSSAHRPPRHGGAGAGEPVIGGRAKKELIGRYARAGREWRPSGDPRRADVHDFPGDRARRCPTACTTWALTQAGCRWAATATPPSSPSRPSGAGWTASARSLTPVPRRS